MSKKIIEDSCKGCDISMQAEAVCEICTKNTQLQADLKTYKNFHGFDKEKIHKLEIKNKDLQIVNKRLKAEIKFLQETYIKDPPHKGGAS